MILVITSCYCISVVAPDVGHDAGDICKTRSLFRLPYLYEDARDTYSVHWRKYIANAEHYELKSPLPCIVLWSYGAFLVAVNLAMM